LKTIAIFWQGGGWSQRTDWTPSDDIRGLQPDRQDYQRAAWVGATSEL